MHTEEHAGKFLMKQMDLLQLSARSYSRILKVARTIADLKESPGIELNHVAEESISAASINHSHFQNPEN